MKTEPESAFIKPIVVKSCVSQTVSQGTLGPLDLLIGNSQREKGSVVQAVWEFFDYTPPVPALSQHTCCLLKAL